jgi:kynurenine formamidase
MCLPGTIETVRAEADEQGIVAAEHDEETPSRVDRRTVLVGGAGAALAALLPTSASAGAGAAAGQAENADLTHVFREGSPVFTGPEPQREALFTFAAAGFYSQKWTFGEHSGTHMDAPGHFVRGGRLSPQITLPELAGIPIVVVDISARADRNPDATLTARDLTRFESRHGRIPNRALVAMNSGWWRKINNERAYKGGNAFPNYHFPGFRIDAAEWLLDKRSVSAIGVDTMSLDPGNSTKFPVHLRWLGANKYGLENLANLDRVPPKGARVFVGLIPWERGSGGPSRVIASWGARAGVPLAG